MTERILHIDVESRSPVDLPAANAFIYFDHPDPDLWCAAFSFREDPDTWQPGDLCPDEVRDHIKLPSFTLGPLAGHFKMMAQLDASVVGAQQGILKLRVNDQDYDLQVSTHPTPWGERVELRFAS